MVTLNLPQFNGHSKKAMGQSDPLLSHEGRVRGAKKEAIPQRERKLLCYFAANAPHCMVVLGAQPGVSKVVEQQRA